MAGVVDHRERRSPLDTIRARQGTRARLAAGPRPSVPGGLRRPPGRRRCLELRAALGVPRAAPPGCRHGRRRGVAAAAALALAVAVAVVLFGALAAPEVSGPYPRSVVVQVRPGESLTDLARRVAPHSDSATVVRRIRDANGLSTSALHPGQPVEVPLGG